MNDEQFKAYEQRTAMEYEEAHWMPLNHRKRLFEASFMPWTHKALAWVLCALLVAVAFAQTYMAGQRHGSMKAMKDIAIAEAFSKGYDKGWSACQNQF